MSSERVFPQAPTDPRIHWSLPAHGTMPAVEQLDELVSRVLAPNASHMTLDGTNTYVVGEPGAGTVMVVDPGPDDPSHRRRVESVIADRDAECELVLVTHHHEDHSEAARSWALAFGCRVASANTAISGPDGWLLADGETFYAGGLQVETLATPGHCADHLVFRLPNRIVLTGDHVLGRGTSVVAWPEGDLLAYLDSLHRVYDLGPEALYPGHGPALHEDPSAVLDFYLEHRAFREKQLIAALAEGPMTLAQLVHHIYVDLAPVLVPAAEMSTRAGLKKLMDERTVAADGSGHFRLLPPES